MNETVFKKYERRGAYHWQQVSGHLLKRNCFVLARYENVIDLITQKTGSLNGKTVLDVGCGDGVLSCMLGKKGAIVDGIDYSEDAISYARQKTDVASVHYTVGSAYDLPYPDSSFDVVVSSDVIEHLSDIDSYLCEMNRVAKKGGIVVISTPVRFTEEPLDKEHIREYFPDEFRSVTTQRFTKTDFYYSHPLLWREVYVRSILCRVGMNVLSYVYNPFKGFSSKLVYKELQYSVSEVC